MSGTGMEVFVRMRSERCAISSKVCGGMPGAGSASGVGAALDPASESDAGGVVPASDRDTVRKDVDGGSRERIYVVYPFLIFGLTVSKAVTVWPG